MKRKRGVAHSLVRHDYMSSADNGEVVKMSVPRLY